MVTLSACLIGNADEIDCYLKPCIEKLLLFCDEIVFVNTCVGSDDYVKLNVFLDSFKDNRIKVVHKKFEKPEDYTNCINFGIDHCTKEWVLHVDCDEVIGDNFMEIFKALNEHPEIQVWSLTSEHLIYHLGYRDATFNPHVHGRRLHLNAKEFRYPKDSMHGLVEGFSSHALMQTKEPMVYHMGYCKNLCSVMKRFSQNFERLEIHTPEFLNNWKNSHLFGYYPLQVSNPFAMPKELKEYFRL